MAAGRRLLQLLMVSTVDQAAAAGWKIQLDQVALETLLQLLLRKEIMVLAEQERQDHIHSAVVVAVLVQQQLLHPQVGRVGLAEMVQHQA